MTPVTYLEVDQEAQGELPRQEADQAQHEGGEQALAGDQGAATREEGRAEGQQPRGQQRPGHDGELVPGRGEVEVLRHQERGPGRGQQQPEQHHQEVHGAHAPPEQGVAASAAHCDHLVNFPLEAKISHNNQYCLFITCQSTLRQTSHLGLSRLP